VPDDGADDLRGHLDAAHAAADRLAREAQARAEGAEAAWRERLGEVPPRGWEVPDEHRPAPGGLEVVVSLLGALRDALPAELTQQLAEAVRELLLALRALIDWCLERLERPPRASAADRVEDIPIA